MINTTDILVYIKQVISARKEQLSWYTDMPNTNLDNKSKARFIKQLQKEIKDLNKAYKIIENINKPFRV